MGFKARYEVQDGYAGKARPKYFTIDECEIEDDMDDSDLSDLYDRLVDEAFLRDVTAYGENRDEFIEWARSIKGCGDDD